MFLHSGINIALEVMIRKEKERDNRLGFTDKFLIL